VFVGSNVLGQQETKNSDRHAPRRLASVLPDRLVGLHRAAAEQGQTRRRCIQQGASWSHCGGLKQRGYRSQAHRELCFSAVQLVHTVSPNTLRPCFHRPPPHVNPPGTQELQQLAP
jgi:hypothetical protein